MSSAHSEPSRSSGLELHANVENQSLSKSDSIELSVALKNSGDKPYTFIVTNREKPYSASLWDASGNDLLASRFAGRSKDRSTPGIEVRIDPGETLAFSSRIDLTTALAEEEIPVSADPVAYDLMVTFPVTTFVDGKYRVDLLKSRRLAIEISDGLRTNRGRRQTPQ